MSLKLFPTKLLLVKLPLAAVIEDDDDSDDDDDDDEDEDDDEDVVEKNDFALAPLSFDALDGNLYK